MTVNRKREGRTMSEDSENSELEALLDQYVRGCLAEELSRGLPSHLGNAVRKAVMDGD